MTAPAADQAAAAVVEGPAAEALVAEALSSCPVDPTLSFTHAVCEEISVISWSLWVSVDGQLANFIQIC